MGYEIIPHSTGAQLKILGYNEEDLFFSSLDGLNKMMEPVLENTEEKGEKTITVEGLDLANLLVEFLNEVIPDSYLNKNIYFIESIRVSKNDEFILETNLISRKVKDFKKNIKTALYKDLDMMQRPDGSLEASVFFEI